MKKLLFVLALCLSTQLNAQIGIDWVRNYGGTNDEAHLDSDSYPNGDIIIIGQTNSNSNDVHGNPSSSVVTWVVKMTGVGDTLWTKCITPLFNIGTKIKVTPDNGFIVFGPGQTFKFDFNAVLQWTLNTQYVDLVVNSNGSYHGLKATGDIDNITSTGIITSSINNSALSLYLPKKLIKTSDSGFLIGSLEEYYPASDPHMDLRLTKLNSIGTVAWSRFYGGIYNEQLIAIKQLADGSYIIGANTESNNSYDVPANYNSGFLNKDIWIIKLDSNGDILWNKCFGSSANNVSNDDLQDLEINSTNEIYFVSKFKFSTSPVSGDYLINRVLNEKDPFYLLNEGTWLVKLTSNGNLDWQGRYGRSSNSSPMSIFLNNSNEEMIVTGSSTYLDGNNEENNGQRDFWIIKFKPCPSTITPTLNEVQLTVNCFGYTSQLETQNIPNASYQWYSQNPNSSFFSFTGQDDYFITSMNPAPSNYCVMTIIDKCPAISSPIAFQSSYIFPPQNQNICIVGLDQATGKNKVVWEKEQTQVISGYNVYRENSQTGFFDLIGSTNYSDSSLFLDATANPIQQAYRYQITYVDTCENESSAGSPHKTMHLTINQGVGTTWNLIWTPYSGISYPSYNIYRGTNPSNMTLLTTVASNITSYTDANAPGGFVYYQIEIVGPNCNPTKSNYNNSRSNVSTNDPSYLGVNEEMISPISIYPNPASTLIHIDYTGKIDKLEILDLKGSVVFVSKENKKEFSLPTHLQTGYYMVVIHDEKQLFRKELLIQR